jgi:hypothetical protein
MTPEQMRLEAAHAVGLAGDEQKNALEVLMLRTTPGYPNAVLNLAGIPKYDTSLDAAKELIEALRKEGLTCSLSNGLDGTWECSLLRDDALLVYAPDDTAELAILKGFLMVKGILKA